MVAIKGLNISGHYILPINTVPFHICILNSKKSRGRTKSYFVLFLTHSTTIRHGVLISGYVDFVSTTVSSN